MKHATLSLLAGLLCLSSALIAVAGPDVSEQSRGPSGFDHGVPVFELPEIVITPDADRRRPEALVRRRDKRLPAVRSNEKTGRVDRHTRSEKPAPSAHYTAMRVVKRGS